MPSTAVADTPTTYAFRDINPAAPVHVLVVPRDHIESLQHVDPTHTQMLTDCFATIRTVAEQEGLADNGYRVVVNTGRHAGMTIPHLHFHVLGGRPMRWPPE